MIRYIPNEEGNAIPYKIIGLQNAWSIIKASRVKLNKVHAGIIDTAVYIRSGQELSQELYFPDENGKYPKGKVQILPLDGKYLTNETKTGS